MAKEKKLIKTPFSNVIIIASFLLMALPFITTFNSFLTDLFLRWEFYKFLQDLVVPYEAKVLAGILNSLGFPARSATEGVWVGRAFMRIEWNCLGWQSAVLLLASLLSGFQGKFSWSSRIQVVLIGLLGTYLIQFFRLSTFGVLAFKVGTTVAIFFHDYLALIMVIFWFVGLWWFSYSFVLEEK